MIRFNDYLNEYWAPGQEEAWMKANKQQLKGTSKENAHLLPKAKKATDHFFGENNHEIIEDLQTSQQEHEKSETQKSVEHHLRELTGRDRDGNTVLNFPDLHTKDENGNYIGMSKHQYLSGQISDRHGRLVNIGKAIRDQRLKNEYASDSVKSGSNKKGSYRVRIRRGKDVAPMTNPEPNKEHPDGHDWKDESCMNIKSGSNNHYLPEAVKHGVVSAVVEDENGKEIHRTVFSPHHDKKGNTVYAMDGSYGIQSPDILDHMNNLANKLSGESKQGIFKKNPNVYNNNRVTDIIHPNAPKEYVDHLIANGTKEEHFAVLSHRNLDSDQMSKLISNPDPDVATKAAQHRSLQGHHINWILSNGNSIAKQYALHHPRATSEHVKTALNDYNPYVGEAAIRSHAASSEQIANAISSGKVGLISAAMRNRKTTREQLNQGMDHDSHEVRASVLRNPKATRDHFEKGINDKHSEVVKQAALLTSNPDYIQKGLDHSNEEVVEAATRNPNITDEQLKQVANHKNITISGAAATQIRRRREREERRRARENL